MLGRLTKALAFAIVLFTPVPLRAGTEQGYVLRFLIEFDKGADCPLLLELRNAAKNRGATEEQLKMMDEKLSSVGCVADGSKRRSDGGGS